VLGPVRVVTIAQVAANFYFILFFCVFLILCSGGHEHVLRNIFTFLSVLGPGFPPDCYFFYFFYSFLFCIAQVDGHQHTNVLVCCGTHVQSKHFFFQHFFFQVDTSTCCGTHVQSKLFLFLSSLFLFLSSLFSGGHEHVLRNARKKHRAPPGSQAPPPRKGKDFLQGVAFSIFIFYFYF
jgi:hypothetical protein